MTEPASFLHKKSKQDMPVSEKLYNVCMAVLFLFALFVGLFLAYYSLRYSYYSPVNYKAPIYLVKDHPVFNLLVFLTACCFSVFLNHFFEKLGNRKRQAGYLFLGICCALYAFACSIWISALPYYPSGDQLIATAAAHYNLEGNFVMLEKTGYLGKFPYQKGLTFLYEILFTLFGHFCYTVAARIHILLGVITMIFGYLFVEETSSHDICKILYCPLVLFCIPYLIFTPYTYGDLPSICFCTVLFWALLRFTRTWHFRYVFLGCAMATLSLMVRLHTWIVLIAVLIGMVMSCVHNRAGESYRACSSARSRVSKADKLQSRIQSRRKDEVTTYARAARTSRSDKLHLCGRAHTKALPILAGLLIILSAFGSTKLLDYSYALRSGYEITEGAPMILSLAMGLQDNENGPGTYNNYQTDTLSSVGFDNAAASEIARKNIQENMERFTSDPSYGKWFFKTKLQRQWIEPTFEALKSTHSFDEKKALPRWIEQLYSGTLHDPVINFADRYQSIVYLGFLCSLPILWKKRRENAVAFIPLISIVGGFLFSILWESQCRYVLPYYLFLLMYVPEGLFLAGESILLALRRLRRRP